MKKTYIPAAIIIEQPVTIATMICISDDVKQPTTVYGLSDNWQNEKNENPQFIEKNYFNIDTQAKGRGGDWGNIW